jgi:MFS family permease
MGSRFWMLWSSSAVSNLADGAFRIGLPLLAVSLTDSPPLVAGVTIASRLPWLVFALLAGALVDRLDRRRTMVFVQLGRVALVGALAVSIAAGSASIVLVYVVAFCLGVLETVFDTAAQAILPSIVGADRLSAANSRLHAAELTMSEFVGPPLGGLLAALGLAAAFGATAAGYLGAALLLLSLPGSFRAQGGQVGIGIGTDILEGLRFLARHRLLRTLAAVVAVVNLANAAVWSVFVLYAVAPGPMGLSEVSFGALLGVGALGSVAGTMLAGAAERRLGRANVLAAAIAAVALQYVVIAFSASPLVVGSLLVAGNAVLGTFNVVFISLRQRIAPGRLLGRVTASFRLVAWGTLPVGALFGGICGALLGLPAVFLLAGLVTLTLLPARLIVTDDAIAAAERAAAERAAA